MSAPIELTQDMTHARHQILTQASDILTSAELEEFRVVLEQMSDTEVIEYLGQWYQNLYRENPVSVKEWIENPRYMGLSGQIYPTLQEDFEEMFSGKYDEAVLTGSIGWGKSYIAGLSLTRMVYEVSCLHNPQPVYGLSEGTPIVFLNIATTFTTAKEVVFEYVKGFVERSPYFRDVFPLDKNLNKELTFPNQVRISPVASTQSGLLGQNTFGGVIDEANFMFKSVKSNRNQGVNTEYDHAKILHNAMIRRMKSRFMQQGKLPGLLLTVSSSLYPDDFTEYRIQMAKEENDERVFWRRYSQWTPKPKHFYVGDVFKLSLGNHATRARIIRKEGEKGYDADLDNMTKIIDDGIKVIDVPVEYRQDFERDIDMAIRDIAGYPTLATHPFFKDMGPISESIERAKARGLKHTFSAETVNFQGDAWWLEDALSKVSKEAPLFVHVDLAINQDAAGVAVVSLDEIVEKEIVKPVEVFNYELNMPEMKMETVTELAPKMSTVLMLQVKNPAGGEIDPADIRQTIAQLYELGYTLQEVTYDQYQSAESIQQFIRMGIDAGRTSVDRSMDPYNSLKEAFFENRLDMYEHPVAVQELSRLERDLQRNKVDHPPKGSKDVTDALAGAVYNATMYVHKNSSTLVMGETYTDKHTASDVVAQAMSHIDTRAINRDNSVDDFEDITDFSWVMD